MQALVSLHDVMPDTLPQVERIIALIPAEQRPNVCLLVVPGREWTMEQINTLRHWQTRDGIELAGHGWTHQAPSIQSFYHRLHSLLISRRAAEHLSHDREALISLVQHNFEWFEAHALSPPQLYVPPAWAMGPLKREDQQLLPFRYYEDTGGVYDSLGKRYLRLPLAGFEADTWWRAFFLRLWNRCNRLISSETRPLRLSIHPNDLDLALGAEAQRWLAQTTHWRSLASIFR